ncbi:MAG: hypothetical protein ACLUI3_02085 [Christensenellales bacterium]
MFDVFTWCRVPTAWLLPSNGMGIVPLYFSAGAGADQGRHRLCAGQKGVWIHNIVAPVAEKEAAEK